jgi:ribonuclease G
LLRSRWEVIKKDSIGAKAPSLVYEDLPLHLRVMRDIINKDTLRIVVDNQDIFDVLQRFLQDFIPEKLSQLELAMSGVPLFDAHNLEDQIEAALQQKVPLKSGGYLIIDQTEAMTTVDVNTGAFVGRKDLEDTIYRTNLEAAAAIPRQLRLRNMGGIVIIDFIDMLNEEHKRQVLRTLEKGQQTDRVKWNITEISELGLVEMTRKRTHESLLKMMCEPCSHCTGRGFIKTAESVCLEIIREIKRRALHLKQKDCLIMASQTVVDRLIDEESSSVAELASALDSSIRFQVETSYTQEQFDVVLLNTA